MMAGKRYYWLKLKEDFFSSKRIKKLRKLAGGDTFTIIYLKMQLKAVKSGGVLTFDGLEKTFAEEIALDIDEEPENVQLTLSYLVSCGLVETSDNVSFFLPFVVENTGSEGSSAQRMRELRSRQMPQTLPEASHCDILVTESKREEKEIELEIDKDIKPPVLAVEDAPRYDYESFKTVYNSTCTNLPSCRMITDKRKRAIKTFLKDFTVEQWKEICRKANQSSFLTGKGERGWKADIDFLLRTDKAAKIFEGGYQDESKRPPQRKGDIFAKAEERAANGEIVKIGNMTFI